MRHRSAASVIQRLALAAFVALLLAVIGSTEPTEAVPQTITVDTTADTVHSPFRCTPTPSDCSLRDALEVANGTVDTDTILFAIGGTGQRTITTATQLPYIINPVEIDGTSQPKSGDCAAAGVPCIVLAGPGDVGDQDGLVFQANSSVEVRGLAITYYVSAIWAFAGSDHVIEDNWLGTRDGTTPSANRWGVYIEGAQNTRVGTADHGNLIFGNEYGIQADATTGVLIQANVFGLTTNGTALGNDHGGIYFNGTSLATIGGNTANTRNVISGNGSAAFPYGVHLKDVNLVNVLGNYVGLDEAGTTAIGNGGIDGIGVWVEGSSEVNVGGLNARNVIAGHGTGVRIQNTNDSSVLGNYIGTNETGTAALEQQVGVSVFSPPNEPSGNITVEQNLIAASSGSTGVFLDDLAHDSDVTSNLVGTNAAGTESLGAFHSYGIQVRGTDNAVVGNTVSNYHSDNSAILVTTATNTKVLSNYVGTNAAGDDLLGGGVGIFIRNSQNTIVGSTTAPTGSSTQGGSGAGAGGNVIRNAADAGVRIAESAPLLSSENTISANSIYDNGGPGIDLVGEANENQPAPVLTGVDAGSVAGTLDGDPGRNYRIEFFASPDCDSSGFGEGRDYLGSVTQPSDNSGNVVFDEPVAGSVPGGYAITATATEPDGNTSEFSNCVIVPGPTATPTLPATPSPTLTAVPSETEAPSGTPSIVQGDADCDGDVDFEDVMAILEFVALLSPPPECFDTADANCDAAANEEDALLIALYLADVPAVASPPCPPIGT